MEHDYGCAREDTMFKEITHVSVTKDEKGGYPFKTIPLEDLKPIKE